MQLHASDTSTVLHHDSATRLDSKEEIGLQLDAFAAEHKLRPLRDRLNIGLNEVGMLAYEKTRRATQALCEKVAGDPEKAGELYAEVVGMCVDVQQKGPWDYAAELNNPKSEVARLWQMLNYAVAREYRESDDKSTQSGNSQTLNDKEFTEDIKRLTGNLKDALENPQGFFEEARASILEGVDRFGVRLEAFKEKEVKSGRGMKTVPEVTLRGKDVKEREWDPTTLCPIADKFDGFSTMAVKGAEVGIAKDADGWVYIGARGEISEKLFNSCGLAGEIKQEYDRKESKRRLTYYRNKDGTDVIKQIHPGLFVVLTRSYDLAKQIVSAVANHKEAVQAAEDCMGHTRIVQTSEKKLAGTKQDDEWSRRAFLRVAKAKAVHDGLSSETAMVLQKDEFYYKLWDIRGRFVYLDALKDLERRRAEKGMPVTDQDKEATMESISEKMWQKVEELHYLNDLLDRDLDDLPASVDRVIDMAGGAGDLGLSITTALLSRGHEIKRTEIVDPQEGTDEFMNIIIENMPPGLRAQMEPVAHHALEHSTGYLQDAEITADSIVVAKHACGTLTDDIIALWKDSKSKFLVAMTCCQDKACGHPSRYNIPQEEWDRLTMETGWTNLGDEVAKSSGNHKKTLEEKFRKGQEAMLVLDNARVQYLRRHGFAAELRTTNKFPKGDTIIARRLPENFSVQLAILERLQTENPLQFDSAMLQIDKMTHGGDVAGKRRAEFGTDWIDGDFRELARCFEAKAKGNGNGSNGAKEGKGKEKVLTEQEQKEITIFGTKLSEFMKSLGVPSDRHFGKARVEATRVMVQKIADGAAAEEIKLAVEKALQQFLPK